uniref:Uncharacterized protein n=1 Tax=Picea glauca TaxID=3330 RepID=A0A101LX13_PICGL|nr:hypothetical protein ABT39_MTgene1418 [Picea glauca]QHR92404.1 hypothetical protein Q903MT_gene6447 [Picea sitchensis]
MPTILTHRMDERLRTFGWNKIKASLWCVESAVSSSSLWLTQLIEFTLSKRALGAPGVGLKPSLAAMYSPV